MIAVNVLKIVGLMIIVCVALLLLYVLLAPRESTRTMSVSCVTRLART